jgi:hypothetical protein
VAGVDNDRMRKNWRKIPLAKMVTARDEQQQFAFHQGVIEGEKRDIKADKRQLA